MINQERGGLSRFLKCNSSLIIINKSKDIYNENVKLFLFLVRLKINIRQGVTWYWNSCSVSYIFLFYFLINTDWDCSGSISGWLNTSIFQWDECCYIKPSIRYKSYEFSIWKFLQYWYDVYLKNLMMVVTPLKALKAKLQLTCVALWHCIPNY